MICIECGHSQSWHLHSDGPLPRICNHPECKCTEFKKEN